MGSSRRYNLALPDDLFREVEELAEKDQTTVVDVIRRFVRLGLLVRKAQEEPGTEFLIREGDRERQVLLV